MLAQITIKRFYMSNYELKKHKAADTVKWIVVFILLIAVGGLAIGLCLKTFGVLDKDKSANVDVVKEESVYQDSLYVKPASTEFVKLLATAAASGSGDYDSDGQTHLTATVEPANAEDTKMDWSIAFKNPSSSWATGKTVTDYLTVTPVSDGALEADVKAVKAFGEQIVITCRSRANSEAYATCTVDYIKRYTLVDSGVTPTQGAINVKLTASEGTIDVNNTLSWSFKFDDVAYAKYKEIFVKHGFSDSDLLTSTLCVEDSVALTGTTKSLSCPGLKGASFELVYSTYSAATKKQFFEDFFSSGSVSGIIASAEKHNKATAAIREWLDYIKTEGMKNASDFAIYRLNISINSKNEQYGFSQTSKVENFRVGYDSGSYSQYEAVKNSILDVVTGVEMSQGSIVF